MKVIGDGEARLSSATAALHDTAIALHVEARELRRLLEHMRRRRPAR